MNKLEKYLVPLANKIGKNKYLVSIRDGFLVTTPLLIVGSFFLIIAAFPIDGWEGFWTQFFGSNWTDIVRQPVRSTLDLMAIFAVFGIAYSFAREMKTNKLFCAALATAGFFILMPFNFNVEVGEEIVNVGGISTDFLSANGIFVGIFCAFLAVHIYAFIEKKGWMIRMPQGVPPTVAESFSALIPAAVVITIFFIIQVVFSITPWTNAFNFILEVFQNPLKNLGNSLGAIITAFFFSNTLWFFGINGASIMDAIYNPILNTLSLENANLVSQGLEPINIINTQFKDFFAIFGGLGSTLSLLIAMIFFCKSKRIKSLGKISLIPGIFNINEPIIFGLPIMLNPLMFIPFLIVPTMNIIVSYFAMDLGLVAITNGAVIPWTCPVIISGFLSTGFARAILQVLLVIAGIFVYLPFVKMMDKQYLEEEKQTIEKTEKDDISLDGPDLEL
ncbi:PTS sugar transporter subunit IIC [Massilimicrobiota timonensis]|uniref:PTS sugar transporter subunit IIC n=1 Tax=Massilimicrobiota timonensis TaxID=1776392 RepID=UPI00101CA3A3|nr:PTS sugar transporter subunit IIC [Massilimicrobiota timonensis]